MGLKDFLKRLLGGHPKETAPSCSPAREKASSGHGGKPSRRPREGWDIAELARRLGMSSDELLAVKPVYRSFTIPKRKGGQRKIAAPVAMLKHLQKRILHRLLSRLKVHPSVRGFERGQSIVTHARSHANSAVVLHMDIKDFFPSTSAKRVEAYFLAIGWEKGAAAFLTKLCTHEDALPQGAPTSPRLSNLVNHKMDARLAAVAAWLQKTAQSFRTPLDTPQGAAHAALPGARPAVHYTRYADDLTFSFEADNRAGVQSAIRLTKKILADEGYELHQSKKLRIMRRSDRQLVTGLVVNDGVRLPREVRRRLRAVRHHVKTGKPATLTPVQLAGWESLQKMVAAQANPSASPAGG